MIQESYNALLNDEVLSILIGDKNLGEELVDGYPDQVSIEMPYLSRNSIRGIGTMLNINIEDNGTNTSRRTYMQSLIFQTIKHNKANQILNYLFSKENFYVHSEYDSKNEVNEIKIQYIIRKIIGYINAVIIISGNKITYINNKILLVSINSNEIDVSDLKDLNHDAIKALMDKINSNLEKGEYDSVITQCRSLLESVFIKGLEMKGQNVKNSGNIHKLYKQIKDSYNLNPITYKDDNRFKSLLGSLEKIINTVSELRNSISDSHGRLESYNIPKYYAQLIVNSTYTVSEFLISVFENNIHKEHNGDI